MRNIAIGAGIIIMFWIAIQCVLPSIIDVDAMAEDLAEDIMARHVTEEPRTALLGMAVPTPDTEAAISSFEHPSNHRVSNSDLGRAVSVATIPPDVLTWSVKAATEYLRQGRRFDMDFVQEAVFAAEGAIYGERGEWVVTVRDVGNICRRSAILDVEFAIWEAYTWKETAILGAITTGAQSGDRLRVFCEGMGG